MNNFTQIINEALPLVRCNSDEGYDEEQQYEVGMWEEAVAPSQQ